MSSLTPADLGATSTETASWLEAAQDAASAAWSRLSGWLPDHEAQARHDAARFDEGLFRLRCLLQAQSQVLRALPAERKPPLRKAMLPLFRAYVQHATATYGSVAAARQRFESLPCDGVGASRDANAEATLDHLVAALERAGSELARSEVGLAPVAALPAAVWYGAGAVVATAAVAYATTYTAQVWREVELARVTLERGREYAACVSKGAGADRCQQVMLAPATQPIAADPNSPGAQAKQMAWALLLLGAAVGAVVVVPRLMGDR